MWRALGAESTEAHVYGLLIGRQELKLPWLSLQGSFWKTPFLLPTVAAKSMFQNAQNTWAAELRARSGLAVRAVDAWL